MILDNGCASVGAGGCGGNGVGDDGDCEYWSNALVVTT